MSLVKFRAAGAMKMLLVRTAVSARRRHERREGKIALVFLGWIILFREGFKNKKRKK